MRKAAAPVSTTNDVRCRQILVIGSGKFESEINFCDWFRKIRIPASLKSLTMDTISDQTYVGLCLELRLEQDTKALKGIFTPNTCLTYRALKCDVTTTRWRYYAGSCC